MTNPQYAPGAGTPVTSNDANFTTFTGEVPTDTSSMTPEITYSSVPDAIDTPPTVTSLSESYKRISLLVLEIERKVASSTPIAPRELAEMRARLSSYYSWMSERKAELEINRNRYFRAKRADYKSDKACEMDWLSTGEGEVFTLLGYKLKGVEKIISSLRSLIDAAQTEYHH